ncbi:hypothetical protein ACTJIJ_15100 [Niabella sp. 22666]|uniref:hypothetical protein n=1 Tax=Niabella sp. 22666 TaxID=3453954 RepID=UPI003F84F6D6
MSIDELIHKALKEIEGPLNVAGFSAVVSDIQTRELFVQNLQEFFTENLVSFSRGVTASLILMGIYFTEEQAHECVESLYDIGVQSPGLVQLPEWHLVMGNPV